MPENEVFSFSILLGGQPVKEYNKDGETYVMTDLMHPTSYQEEIIEFVGDREERQKIPVTPYQVAITLTSSKTDHAWAKLYVDGSFVRRALLDNGKRYVVKGFNDGDNIKEFLFSLPRFGHDKDDRMEGNRLNKVGCISVELYKAVFLRTEMRNKRLRTDSLEYVQATKKDASQVTKGKYTMATTKPGRCIENRQHAGSKRKHGNDRPQYVNKYTVGKEIGQLHVKYHMRHTLEEMGFDMQE